MIYFYKAGLVLVVPEGHRYQHIHMRYAYLVMKGGMLAIEKCGYPVHKVQNVLSGALPSGNYETALVNLLKEYKND